ncbi:MAG: hypothetical protein QGF68_14570 [Nitrospinota bacterium]|jgi:hypothetical protein|nr:hypothetical protein [Nitrospinota bacterium]
MTEGKMATVRAASKLVGPGRGVCEVRGRRYRLDAPPLMMDPTKR